MNILFDCFGRTHTDTKPRSAASPLTKLHQEIDLLLCGTKTTKSVVFQDVAITSIEQIDSISGLESLIDALPCSNVEDVLISLDLTLPLHYSPHELKNTARRYLWSIIYDVPKNMFKIFGRRKWRIVVYIAYHTALTLKIMGLWLHFG